MAEDNKIPEPKTYLPEQPKIYNVDTGEAQDFDPSQLGDLLKSGKYTFKKGEEIPVVSPSGTTGTIPSDKIFDALAAGYSYEGAESQIKREKEKQFGDTKGQILSGALGLARGLSANLSDAALVGSGLVDADTIKNYEEVNPSASGVGEAVGILAPAVISGGGALAGRVLGEAGIATAAKAAASITPIEFITQAGKLTTEALMPKIGSETAQLAGKQIAQKIAAKSIGSAVEGALFAGGNILREEALGDPDMSAEKMAAEFGLGALIGGGLGGALAGAGVAKPYVQKYIDKAKGYAKDAVTGALAGAFNVSKEAAEKYLEGKEKKILVPELEAVHEDISRHLSDLFEDVDKKKITLDEAKDKFKEYVAEQNHALESKGFATRTELSDLKAKIKDTFEDHLDALQESQFDTVKNKVVSTMEKVQDMVYEKSAEARELLASHAGDFPLKKIYDKFDELIETAKSKPSAASEEVIRTLEAQKNRIMNEYGEGRVRGNAMKNIIQGFDADTRKYFGMTTEKNAAADALKQVRYVADDLIKTKVPAYKAKMAEVSGAVKALDNLPMFMDDQKAFRALNRIASKESQEFVLPALRKLEEISGVNLTSEMDDFLKTKSNIKNRIAELAEIDRGLKDPKSHLEFRSMLEGSLASKNLKLAEAELEIAKEAAEKFKGMTPANLEGKLKAAGRGNIAVRNQLEQLPKINGLSVPEMLEHIRARDSFGKEAGSGSRNVNLYSMIMGGILGQTQDTPGGILGGMAGGAYLGALVDKFGPQIAKKMLDAYSTLGAIEATNNIATKKIQSAIGGFVSEVKKKAVPLSLDYIDKVNLNKEKTDRKPQSRNENYQKRLKELTSMVTAPSATIDNVTKGLHAIVDHAPNTASAVGAQAFKAAQFLYEKAPKYQAATSINPELSMKRYRPSDIEMAKFERYVQAVDNPFSALKDFSNGIMTPEQSEALRVVYPRMYDEIRSEVANKLAEMKTELPYSKRIALSTLLNVPIDQATSPDLFMMLQANHGQAQQDESMQNPMSNKKINFSKEGGDYKLALNQASGTELASDLS